MPSMVAKMLLFRDELDWSEVVKAPVKALLEVMLSSALASKSAVSVPSGMVRRGQANRKPC